MLLFSSTFTIVSYYCFLAKEKHFMFAFGVQIVIYILVPENCVMNFLLACGWHSKWQMICVLCDSLNRWASPLQLANMISILQCLSKCQISWISNLWWSIQFLYVQKPRILWKQEKFNWLRYALDTVAFISGGLGLVLCWSLKNKFFDWDNVSSITVKGFKLQV